MCEYGAPPKTLRGEPFYGLELDEEQQIFADAIWNPDNLIIFANACAGSGKTRVLTHRIAYLISEKNKEIAENGIIVIEGFDKAIENKYDARPNTSNVSIQKEIANLLDGFTYNIDECLCYFIRDYSKTKEYKNIYNYYKSKK